MGAWPNLWRSGLWCGGTEHTDSPWVSRQRQLPHLQLFALLFPAAPNEGIWRKGVVDMKNLFPAKSFQLHGSLKQSPAIRVRLQCLTGTAPSLLTGATAPLHVPKLSSL